MDPSREGEDQGQLGGLNNENIRAPTTMAGVGSQLRGGGAAVMEKQGLDLGQVQMQSQAKTDDTGGGGNNGKNINNGGGGDGDDGDDDDYFDDDDEDDGDDDGVFSRRVVIPELFDRATIEAVLSEWFKTLYSLPSGLRMAVEMGLVSSAQLVRFLGMDVRPTVVRAISRHTPDAFSRGFVGRLMGDPSILLKMGYEQVITASFATFYEVQQRGDKFGKEMDLAAVNVLGAMMTNAAMVWLLCPNRSFGAPPKFALQRAVGSLPSNVFDRSGPLREYTLASRAGGFLWKAAQLSAIGAGVGAVSGAASQLLCKMRGEGFRPALRNPSMATSTAGMGAFAGITGNARYQLVNGLDRYMLQTFNSLPLTLGVSAMVRFGGAELGEQTRLHWLGLPKQSPSRRTTKTVVVKKKVVKRVRKTKRSSAAATSPSSDASAFSVSAAAPSRSAHH